MLTVFVYARLFSGMLETFSFGCVHTVKGLENTLCVHGSFLKKAMPFLNETNLLDF